MGLNPTHSDQGNGGIGINPALRSRLAFFAGNFRNGHVRSVVRSHFQNDTDIVLLPTGPNKVPPEQYRHYLETSKFCLCLAGWRVWSPRLVDGLFYGCVPVIIADHYDLPLGEFFDWNEFSVNVAERNIPRLKSILQAIPEERVRRMQERIQQVYMHFVWNSPPKPYDTFYLSMLQLWRRRRLRPLPPLEEVAFSDEFVDIGNQVN
jgi:hypothetical protein